MDHSQMCNAVSELIDDKFISDNNFKKNDDSVSFEQTKLKIYCISDLHLELYKSYKKVLMRLNIVIPKDIDVLILAGDIGYPMGKNHKHNYIELLKSFKSQYKYVILIAGNHEYYETINNDREFVTNELIKIAKEANVILLNNNSIIINRIKFIGTILWSHADKKVEIKLNDFKQMFTSVEDYNNEYEKCFNWLKDELNDKNDKSEYDEIIVITHHLPTEELVHEKFRGYEYGSAFYTNILDDLKLNKVKYWFCGHSHEYMTYQKNDTKIILNPVGYPDEKRVTKISSQIYTI